MARPKSNRQTPASAEVPNEENNVSAVTEESVEVPVAEATESTESSTESQPVAEATESTESESTEKPAEVAIDLTEFETDLAAAIESADTSTGDVPEAFLQGVVASYRKLEGQKAKSAARKLVENGMREAMDNKDFIKARANLQVSDNLTSAPAAKERTPKPPADPTEAYVELVAGLRLALALAESNVPEGVKPEWAEQVVAKADEQSNPAQAFLEWARSEDEEKGDKPEVEPYVEAAVNLALGKSGKVGRKKAVSTGTRPAFEGPRRDVAKHILEAFEGKESGEFLTIGQIAKFDSNEYGDDHPSSGAVSARLFPKSGKVSIEGVIPDTNESGIKGARKA